MGQRKELPPGVQIEKLDCHGSILTAYRVTLNGQEIGFVRREVGFSYRGKQGWNRGVRLQDYHPKEWRYSRSGIYERGLHAFSRHEAVGELVRQAALGEEP